MTALPHQDVIQLPISWTGDVKKITMDTGSTSLSGTVGIRPWKESATISWVLSRSDAQALLTTFKSGYFNSPYTYTCSIRGDVNLIPNGSYGFAETDGINYVTVSVGFDTL